MHLPERKDKYSVEELRRKTMERIQQGREGIHIYTDGSTDGDQEKRGAGVYIETEDGEELERLSLPAGKWCFSYGGGSV